MCIGCCACTRTCMLQYSLGCVNASSTASHHSLGLFFPPFFASSHRKVCIVIEQAALSLFCSVNNIQLHWRSFLLPLLHCNLLPASFFSLPLQSVQLFAMTLCLYRTAQPPLWPRLWLAARKLYTEFVSNSLPQIYIRLLVAVTAAVAD